MAEFVEKEPGAGNPRFNSLTAEDEKNIFKVWSRTSHMEGYLNKGNLWKRIDDTIGAFMGGVFIGAVAMLVFVTWLSGV